HRPYMSSLLFLTCTADHRDLHSFPTRRSSDLRLNKKGSKNINLGIQVSILKYAPNPPATPPIILLSGSRYNRLRTLVCSGFEGRDRKSTRLNSSHVKISYAVFCLKKKKK